MFGYCALSLLTTVLLVKSNSDACECLSSSTMLSPRSERRRMQQEHYIADEAQSWLDRERYRMSKEDDTAHSLRSPPSKCRKLCSDDAHTPPKSAFENSVGFTLAAIQRQRELQEQQAAQNRAELEDLLE